MKGLLLGLGLIMSLSAQAFINLSNPDLAKLQNLLERAVYSESFGNCGMVEGITTNSRNIKSSIIQIFGEDNLTEISLSESREKISEILARMTRDSFFKELDNQGIRTEILKMAKSLEQKFNGAVIVGQAKGVYHSKHQILALYDNQNQELLFYAEGICE